MAWYVCSHCTQDEEVARSIPGKVKVMTSIANKKK